MSLLTRLWNSITMSEDPEKEADRERIFERADELRQESEEMLRVIDRNAPSGNWVRDMATGVYAPRENDRA